MVAGTKKSKGLFIFHIQHPVQQEGLFIQLSGWCAWTHEESWELKSSTQIPDPRIGVYTGNVIFFFFLIDCLLNARLIAIFFLYSLMTKVAQL